MIIVLLVVNSFLYIFLFYMNDCCDDNVKQTDPE